MNSFMTRGFFVGFALMLTLAGCGGGETITVDLDPVEDFGETKVGTEDSEADSEIVESAPAESYALPLPADPSIVDYYLAIPDEILTEEFYYPFYPTGPTEEARRAAIQVADETNYYLKLTDHVQSGGMETFAMTVFIKPDDTPLIALEGGTTAGALSFRDLRFFEVREGEWVDVTEGQFPELDFDTLYNRAQSLGRWLGFDPDGPYSFYMELPRYGTDLVLVENTTGEEMARMGWREGAFFPKSFTWWTYDDYSRIWNEDGSAATYEGNLVGLTFPFSWETVTYSPDFSFCPEGFLEDDPQGLAFCWATNGYHSFWLTNELAFTLRSVDEAAGVVAPADYVWVGSAGGSSYYTSAEDYAKEGIASILETLEFLPANPF